MYTKQTDTCLTVISSFKTEKCCSDKSSNYYHINHKETCLCLIFSSSLQWHKLPEAMMYSTGVQTPKKVISVLAC